MPVMPYRAGLYGVDEEEQDSYLRDGGASDRQFGGTNNTAPPAPRPYGAPVVTPESAPSTAPTTRPNERPAPQTFAEMQAMGVARPPMPSRFGTLGPRIPDRVTDVPPGGPGGPEPFPQLPGDPENAPIDLPDDVPDDVPSDLPDAPTAVPDDVPEDAPDEAAPDDAASEDAPNVDVLDELEENVTEDTEPEVTNAARALLLQLLGQASPYDNAAMQAEFENLAGGIDAGYDARQRALSDQFARRGLYGSVGKDFASGRAADTEIGRRTAKTQLASDLATKRATTYSDYVNNAIQTAQQFATGQNQQELAALAQLMGFGQQAFENDLATNAVNQDASDSWAEFLQQLLSAGYA